MLFCTLFFFGLFFYPEHLRLLNKFTKCFTTTKSRTQTQGEYFPLKAFMLSALNSLNASLYLCVWNRVDWWKWEWGDVGLKESWGERGATHTPSQGQGGATHPSAQRERGAADAPTQCERVLETGVDTYKIRKLQLVKKIFQKETFRPHFFLFKEL